MECKNCNSKDIEEDEARAVMICQDCGEVWEMTDIQVATEFHEMDNGRVVALGKIVCTQEAKQNTINKARARIDNLCSKLFLNKVVADNAVAIFKSALQCRLTRGKKASVMSGACVYLAARLNKQALMLLDISDKINENVYTIGKVFNDIKTKFHQHLADIDPCLFIDRFAMQMELGDKREEVSLTALKLLQRMKKDWISTGRRPSGITAAALLIAARIHRFDRHYDDVARIAGISQHTVKKRLQEWAETATATLTLSEFKTIDYEEECNPPSFSEQSSNQLVLNEVQISDEQFAKIQLQIQAMHQKLEEVEQENTEKPQSEKYFSQLMNSVEEGNVDITELLGNIDDDTSDIEVEEEGRRDLIKECFSSKSETAARSMLQKLSKQEVLMENEHGKEELNESENDQLPMTMNIPDEECPWSNNGSTVLDMSDINENELISQYILSAEESVKKLHWFFKENNKFYRNKKIAREKKEERLRKEKRKPGDEKSGKMRRRRQKSISEYIEEARQLVKQDPSSSQNYDYQVDEPLLKKSRQSPTHLGDANASELVTKTYSEYDEEDRSAMPKFEVNESVGERDDASDVSECVWESGHNPDYDSDSY